MSDASPPVFEIIVETPYWFLFRNRMALNQKDFQTEMAAWKIGLSLIFTISGQGTYVCLAEESGAIMFKLKYGEQISNHGWLDAKIGSSR